jgi:type I restriction enzyme, S subunit
MNAERLSANFDRLVELHNGAQHLRRFVLDLAIRGKLVAPDPVDEPMPEVLSRLRHQKANVAKHRMRSKPVQREIEGLEIPFPTTPEILFARLDEVAIIEKGNTGIQRANPGQYSLVTLAEERGTCSEYQFEGAAAIVPLISSTGHGHASLKRMHYQEGKFALGNILCAVIPVIPELLSARFLFEYLWAYKEPLLVEKMTGTANVSLTMGKIGEAPVPIISRRAQDRLHDLMTLCDRLEAAQAERESRRDRLVSASLYRLSQPAEDATAFRDDARFALDHLARFTTRPEHIPQLRQTILNLAVRGKLVPQDPKEEPGSELLARIQAEKARLTRDGELRKEKLLSPVTRDEEPFAVADNWVWARIGTCSLLTEYGTSVKSDYRDDGVPVLKMGDIQGGRVVLGGQKKVPREIDDLPQLFLKRLDLLYNRTNSPELVGKTGIYRKRPVTARLAPSVSL